MGLHSSPSPADLTGDPASIPAGAIPTSSIRHYKGFIAILSCHDLRQQHLKTPILPVLPDIGQSVYNSPSFRRGSALINTDSAQTRSLI